MNKKNLVIIISIIALFVALVAIFIAWQNRWPKIVQEPPFPTRSVSISIKTSTISDTSEWKIYENTKYGYRFKYPSEAIIQKVAEMERSEVDESGSIVLGVPKYGVRLEITGGKFLSPKEDLKSFANTSWQYQKNSQNRNIEKKVGELQQIEFASTTAYIFSLEERSSEYARQKEKEMNFPPTDRNSIFLFVESPKKEKFFIKFSANNQTSQQIINSFEFINE